MTRVEKPFVSSDKEHGLMCGTDDGVDVMHPGGFRLRASAPRQVLLLRGCGGRKC